MINEESFTVSELNNFIKDVLNAGIPQPVWVCGEIQGYDRQKDKNHIFFQLVEKDGESHQQKACIDLVIWAGNKIPLRQILRSAAESFELKDDIEVKFLCKVDFYPPHGRVRLSVESIDPFFTLGKLAQEKQRLIRKLTEEGVLERNKMLDLSSLPLRIGLISSHDSAAYNDFLSELKKSGFGFQVYFRNALMQGKKAETDVVAAMTELNAVPGLDAVVITRGGGSLSDLSCFDSELIARSIASYRVPVLSGIGHEINITVTDLAAHTHAKTPTAIAQFLIRRLETALEELKDKEKRVIEGGLGILERAIRNLKEDALGLQSLTQRYLQDHNIFLVRFLERINAKPVEILRQQEASLERYLLQINKCAKVRLQQDQQKLRSFEKLIDMAHPANTLKRGFSITRTKEGEIVRSAGNVDAESVIVTQLAKGVLESKVQKINKE